MKHQKMRTDRQLLLLPLIMAAILIVGACSGTGGETSTVENGTEQRFTLDELAQYDGLEGRMAYIAVDGVVYDVTDIPEWAGGSHAGGEIMAGKDYSEEIRNISPHGTSVLSRAKKVGVLSEG